MSLTIIPAASFLRDLKQLSKKCPSLKEDVNKLAKQLKTDPETGVALGKDCYKIRLAIKSKGKGKSGGARVITCVKIIQSTVYLLSIYDKAGFENISDTALQQRLNEISENL
ncbi:type II toxin-antitoxin system RelE/ParE family toxin [Niabella ginsengisoli]|uniref:Type II toxin-antitoxin system RelE/ParE family toxin n=1 Tax=Niabella ginsengisoli TaxID=522298 RepID=A0ABS9SPG6_9BACT|nr:type II toxin-antitoxin system RelE/ParE family toxin [Niabella ginsengisoli]MCH5600265.1 type II toxin-antitoxin system RelE/ParE family toxin [Niabella ginsengisoli]